MKKVFVLMIFSMMILGSCKEEDSSKNLQAPDVVETSQEFILEDGHQLYEGSFVYSVDAGVLIVDNEFYAVETDSLMFELDRVANALKKDEYDAVNVVIHGAERPNPLFQETGEGWKRMITIKKIIEVSPADNSRVIKTGGANLPYNASK